MSAARVLIAGTNRLAAAIEERLRAGGAAVGRLAEDPAALTAAALEDATGLVIASDDDARQRRHGADDAAACGPACRW